MPNAATVSDLLPPPSYSRMMDPVLVLSMMLSTMAATPGRDQSRGSTVAGVVLALIAAAGMLAALALPAVRNTALARD